MRTKFKYDFITIIFYILLAATAVWDYIYRDGGKLGRILLIYITIFIAKIIFTKTFMKQFNSLYKITLGFIFISMYLANVFNFYSLEYYDKFLHLISGVILGIIGLVFYMYLSNNSLDNKMKKSTVIIFPMMFAIAAAGIWEIWEFATDQMFGLMAQFNDLHDTMWDIICGTIGGGFTAFLIYLSLKGKNIKGISNIIKDKK